MSTSNDIEIESRLTGVSKVDEEDTFGRFYPIQRSG
jgi:hypothetical protein